MKKTIQRASLLFAFGAGLAVAPLRQDPPPVVPPPAATTPPDPATKEPPIGTAKPSPFQGVYRLSTRWVDGKRLLDPGSGYLSITARHLFLCVGAVGSRDDRVQLRSSVRTWRLRDDLVQTKVLCGWLTDDNGTIVFEPAGTEETRGMELVRGGLRIVQDARNWLEFERVE